MIIRVTRWYTHLEPSSTVSGHVPGHPELVHADDEPAQSPQNWGWRRGGERISGI